MLATVDSNESRCRPTLATTSRGYAGPERRTPRPDWLTATLDEVDYGMILLTEAGHFEFDPCPGGQCNGGGRAPGQHDIACLIAWMMRFDDRRDRLPRHHAADLDGFGIGFPIFHATAHIGVE